jgi:hypothetical protein
MLGKILLHILGTLAAATDCPRNYNRHRRRARGTEIALAAAIVAPLHNSINNPRARDRPLRLKALSAQMTARLSFRESFRGVYRGRSLVANVAEHNVWRRCLTKKVRHPVPVTHNSLRSQGQNCGVHRGCLHRLVSP